MKIILGNIGYLYYLCSMNINLNIEYFDMIGVYQIKNKITKRIYIGSTTVSFRKRFNNHLWYLRKNNHKNIYLQRSFNKHGENNFEFSILQVCKKEDCLKVEQEFIDKLDVINKAKGFILYPLASGTPNMSIETIEKRRQTMLRRYASGELDYLKELSRLIGDRKRGIKLLNTDHLKVSKTITCKVINSRKNKMEKVRDLLPEIYVYDMYMKFLGKWRSIPDLSEWSLSRYNNLPIINRFKNSRNIKGKITPINFLKSSNIQTACKNNSIYKGLYFNYKLLHQVIDVEKQGELLENPTSLEDNQHPSLISNDFEGSTTNSQIQTSNVEDSNANTSALPINYEITSYDGDDIV